MKTQSRARHVVGLLIATAFFGYCGAHEIKVTDRPGIAYYLGVFLVPGILLVLLAREVLAMRKEHQRLSANRTNGEVPNQQSDGIRR